MNTLLFGVVSALGPLRPEDEAAAQVAIDVGINLGGFKLPDGVRHIKRWHEAVSSRPSAKA